MKTSLAQLFSGKCPQKVLRSVIGTLVALFKDEFDLDMNSDPSISTTQHGATTDTIFMRGLEHLKSQLYLPYFSYRKSNVTSLSL